MSLRYALFQAVLAAAGLNPVLKLVAKCLKELRKSHKVVVAIVRRLIIIANATVKTGTPWPCHLDG